MAIEMTEEQAVQATFEVLEHETNLTIERSEKERVQYSVVHGPLVHYEPMFGIFIFDPDEERNPDCDGDDIILSQAEARLLRDFLNRPEVQKLLDV